MSLALPSSPLAFWWLFSALSGVVAPPRRHRQCYAVICWCRSSLQSRWFVKTFEKINVTVDVIAFGNTVLLKINIKVDLFLWSFKNAKLMKAKHTFILDGRCSMRLHFLRSYIRPTPIHYGHEWAVNYSADFILFLAVNVTTNGQFLCCIEYLVCILTARKIKTILTVITRQPCGATDGILSRYNQ